MNETIKFYSLLKIPKEVSLSSRVSFPPSSAVALTGFQRHRMDQTYLFFRVALGNTCRNKAALALEGLLGSLWRKRNQTREGHPVEAARVVRGKQ